MFSKKCIGITNRRLQAFPFHCLTLQLSFHLKFLNTYFSKRKQFLTAIYFDGEFAGENKMPYVTIAHNGVVS